MSRKEVLRIIERERKYCLRQQASDSFPDSYWEGRIATLDVIEMALTEQEANK